MHVVIKEKRFSNHHHHRIIYRWYWWTRYRIIIRDDLAHIQKGPEVRAFCLYKKNIKNNIGKNERKSHLV